MDAREDLYAPAIYVPMLMVVQLSTGKNKGNNPVRIGHTEKLKRDKRSLIFTLTLTISKKRPHYFYSYFF